MNKYWFSKSHGLWCEERTKGTYWVLNGQWEGVHNGDEFLIKYTGKVLIITDWIHVTKAELVEMGCDCEYVPNDPTDEELESRDKLWDTFDEDVPF